MIDGEIPDLGSISFYHGDYDIYIDGILCPGYLRFSTDTLFYVNHDLVETDNDPLEYQQMNYEIKGNKIKVSFRGGCSYDSSFCSAEGLY